ncbi:unknown similar to ChocGV orf11 [Mythimna separata entomopoxvirus 'L']|uniref:Uncharacterized protein n=1 Tax=Mythimna separata entomopoxvirus 'L' TaxID=1293572 RepID=A0A916NY68_9POXV|nr:unknown similar to ChocGV orf11 [Mythimna separata entomopoxvirus 'L']CCU56213.1 unknown similar to ChocGV orf11 [Mythimna separata entomopoxvirus 'L']
MKILENIFDDAKNITMFREDDYCEDIIINLNKFINNGKLKILSNNGIDITYKNKKFISDIIFTKENEDFIANIDIDQYNDKLKKIMEYDICNNKLVDYKKEEYWSLTYKIRGYDIKFYHNYVKYPNMGKSNNSFLTYYILNILQQKCSMDESNMIDIDGILESFNCDEKEELENYQGIKFLIYVINKYNLFNESHYRYSDVDDIFNIIYKKYNKIKKILSKINNIILIEYNFVEIPDFKYKNIKLPNFKYEQYKIDKTNILNIYNTENNIKYCTIIFLDEITSPNITELSIHSDEGYYDSGVNVYEDGIVMLCKQNASDCMYYAIAIEKENIVVPDVLILKKNIYE